MNKVVIQHECDTPSPTDKKIMALFDLEMAIPNDWTGSVQVRACANVSTGDDEHVEEVSDAEAQFYGIYVKVRAGLHWFVADRSTKDDADELAQRLRMFGRILVHNRTEAEINAVLAQA